MAVTQQVSRVPVEIPSSSTEYLMVEVVKKSGRSFLDLTTTTIDFAFVAENAEPTGGDYSVAGSWDHSSAISQDAAVLVGPSGTVTLAEGTYDVWIRISGLPNETPTKFIGVLRVT